MVVFQSYNERGINVAGCVVAVGLTKSELDLIKTLVDNAVSTERDDKEIWEPACDLQTEIVRLGL